MRSFQTSIATATRPCSARVTSLKTQWSEQFQHTHDSPRPIQVSAKFEYVVACQMYYHLKTNRDIKASHIDVLRRSFPERMRVAYVEVVGQGRKASFASVLLGADQQRPVLYKVKLPGNPILGEGKPENQNHAIIFTRGEHLQTLDMNQDNYLGEAYKMRNLLECFKGRVRVVGFREHIFSESGGAVAHFAANNEFVFGTMVQRFLTWPLCVRFHYGHPDLWDKVWAFSSGGVSKASRTLHVSEDIFAGFNAVLRGGGVEYLEYIHCGKGRDMGFTAINGFEQKISAGNALQCTSRDLYRMGKNFDFFRLLSFYCSGSGFYMTTMFTVWAVYWSVVAHPNPSPNPNPNPNPNHNPNRNPNHNHDHNPNLTLTLTLS